MKRGGSHSRIVDSQMSWLITGGSGQLGIAVSQELDKRGIAFDAWSSKDLDITQSETVRESIEKLSPTVIINCAAWTDVDGAENDEIGAFRVNSDGPENLATAAKLCNSKLIHLSTDYVFSGESRSPWQIGDEINPQSAYGRTKAQGERRVLTNYPDNSFIVRTGWLYSPWRMNFAKTMTKLAIKGKDEVRVVNDQVGQPTSAMDLAKLLVELGLSTSPAGIYHGTNSGQTTWFEFAQEIFKIADADIGLVSPVSSSAYQRPAKRPSYSVLSHDGLANTLVRPLRDWRIALAETMPAIISAVNAEE
jgi:dTDP-4-dehydrorhamnose reductase